MNAPDQGNPAQPVSISPDVEQALLHLDARERALRRRGDVPITALERLDRARDKLLRHPGRAGDVNKLISSAWGDAGKVIRERIVSLAPPPAMLGLGEFGDAQATAEPSRKQAIRFAELQARFADHDDDSEAMAAIEILDFVARSGIPDRDKRIVELITTGVETAEIADIYGVTHSVAQVWTSRARARARAAWHAA